MHMSSSVLDFPSTLVIAEPLLSSAAASHWLFSTRQCVLVSQNLPVSPVFVNREVLSCVFEFGAHFIVFFLYVKRKDISDVLNKPLEVN